MGRYLLLIFAFFVCMSVDLTALLRNFRYAVDPESKYWYLYPDSEEDEWTEIDEYSPFYLEEDLDTVSSTSCCLAHGFLYAYGEPLKTLPGISKEEFALIPQTREECLDPLCYYRKPIYFGYFKKNYQKYFSNFKNHLSYCLQNRECLCYWPEVSDNAATISDTTHTLIKDLFSSTAFLNLVKDKKQQHIFCNSNGRLLTDYELTLSLSIHQFYFSDYYSLCKDLESYARENYSLGEFYVIKNKLEDILEALHPRFLQLYKNCLAEHYSQKIAEELNFINYLLHRDVNAFAESNELQEKGLFEKQKAQKQKRNTRHTRSQLILKGPSVDLQAAMSVITKSSILLEEACTFHNNGLYKEAIKLLTDAIVLNPLNIKLYMQRATAYLELGDMPSALKDYDMIKKYSPEGFQGTQSTAFINQVKNGVDFTNGFFHGTLRGSKVAAVEFIPSMQNLLHGVWSFVCRPKEVGSEFLYGVYDMGCYLSTLQSSEMLHLFIPEIKDLSCNWKKLSEYEKGENIGYIIGKYGTDVFMVAGSMKILSKCQTLKNADTLLTLERCAASKTNQTIVLEERMKRVEQYEHLMAKVKTGKIVPANPNVCPHVMQKEHAWERLIQLSGSQSEDFKKVLELLEKNDIRSGALISKKEIKISEGVFRRDYEKAIGNEVVKAVFEENMNTQTFKLRDAWVQTR